MTLRLISILSNNKLLKHRWLNEPIAKRYSTGISGYGDGAGKAKFGRVQRHTTKKSEVCKVFGDVVSEIFGDVVGVYDGSIAAMERNDK